MKNLRRFLGLFLIISATVYLVRASAVFGSYSIQNGSVGNGLYAYVSGDGGTDGRIHFRSCIGSDTNCVSFATNTTTFPPPVSVSNQIMFMGSTSPNTTYRINVGSDPGAWNDTIWCRTNGSNTVCSPSFAGCGNYFLEGSEDCEPSGGTCTSTCQLDSDLDGVIDQGDACDTQGSIGFGIYPNGCPILDQDGDSVADPSDACVSVVGPASNNGCPLPQQNDDDGDGIFNRSDQCPVTFGYAEYRGCPLPDDDGDGQPNYADACPLDGGPAWNQGCPEGSSPPPVTATIQPPTPIPTAIAPWENIACNLSAREWVNTTINVRRSPSTTAEIIWRFSPSQGPFFILTSILATDGVWYQIQLSDATGWVREDNVRYAGVNCAEVLANSAIDSVVPATPRATEAPMTAFNYTVQRGDYLYRIAREQCGDGNLWRAIYEANRQLIGNDPNRILPGQVLQISCRPLSGEGRGEGSGSGDYATTGAAAGNLSYEQLDNNYKTAERNYQAAENKLSQFLNTTYQVTRQCLTSASGLFERIACGIRVQAVEVVRMTLQGVVNATRGQRDTARRARDSSTAPRTRAGFTLYLNPNPGSGYPRYGSWKGWCASFVQAVRPNTGLYPTGTGGAQAWRTNSNVARIRYTLPLLSSSTDLRLTNLRPGHVVVWGKSQFGASSSYGHAAVIVAVYRDHVRIRESSWGNSSSPNERDISWSQLKYLTFLGS